MNKPMTNAEIMIQILHEASGLPRTQLQAVFTTLPRRGKLDEVVPSRKAKKLLRDLRKEKAGILQWMADGCI